jgi:hypothetical protein
MPQVLQISLYMPLDKPNQKQILTKEVLTAEENEFVKNHFVEVFPGLNPISRILIKSAYEHIINANKLTKLELKELEKCDISQEKIDQFVKYLQEKYGDESTATFTPSINKFFEKDKIFPHHFMKFIPQLDVKILNRIENAKINDNSGAPILHGMHNTQSHPHSSIQSVTNNESNTTPPPQSPGHGNTPSSH